MHHPIVVCTVMCLQKTKAIAYKTKGGTEVKEIEEGDGGKARVGKRVSVLVSDVSRYYSGSFSGLCQVYRSLGIKQSHI